MDKENLKASAPEASGSVNLETLRKRAAALAEDNDTLGKFVGPKSIPAVKGVMKFLADMLSAKPKLKHVAPTVKKIRRD